MTERFDTIIVGAGLAGLSCAVELVAAGQRVIVLESKPFVGGRTSSWVDDGMAVESGLHRVLGFYREFPKFLQKAGLELDQTVMWEDEVEFRQPEPGPSAVIDASFLHRPLGTLSAVLTHNDYLPPVAKASAAKFFARGLADYAARPQELDRITVQQYAAQQEVHPLVVERLLRPLTAGIFFIPADRYSAYAFFGLIGPYISSSWKLRVGAFRGGMTEVMAQPIAETLKLRGAPVRTESPVQRLQLLDGRVVGVVTPQGAFSAAHVVLAVSLAAAQRITREHWPEHPFFAPMQSLRTMPAATLQIELDGPAMEVDHTTFGVHTALACFSEQSRTTFRQTAGRLSIILSPAERFLAMPPEQVLAVALDEADRLKLRVRGHVKRFRVVNHPADFYALEPNQDHLRPPQTTPIPGLSLAGDYTQQVFLATMEGAVVSGQRAAAAALAAG